VWIFVETHLPNEPYVLLNAAVVPAATSAALQDFAALIVAAWSAWLAAVVVAETHFPSEA
jgi:hypothetical protein